MRQGRHIHTPDDVRGLREVFVNGRMISDCVYADIRKGIADVVRQPLKLDKYQKRILTKRLHGLVEVNAQSGRWARG